MARRTKAGFRALRERIGLSQQDLADELGVTCRSVKRWERLDGPEPPDDAWDLMESMMDDQRREVGRAREEAMSANKTPGPVAVTYWRVQADYDAHGSGQGAFGVANASARAVADELERCGFEVEFRYSDEGASATP